jgi:PleD family two-component response regulator
MVRHTVSSPQPRRAPVVLVVSDQEWSARSLESILMPNGYAVLRAFTGSHGLERARLHAPDVVIVAQSLPDTDGLALCRALRDQGALPDSIPLFLHLAEHATRAERLAALRAGAWDVLAPPLDAEEMILRLEAYVRAKQDADRAQERGLVDTATHFYNAAGLEARAAELAAWAQRNAEPLSCVVLGFVRGGTVDDAEVARAVDAMSDVLRRTGRTSDAIGRTGRTEFAVLAPGADGAAAVRLAERLAATLRPALPVPGDDHAAVQLRGGYDSVSDARETPLKGHELISRATIAFNRARSGQNGTWLRPFQSAAPTLM